MQNVKIDRNAESIGVVHTHTHTHRMTVALYAKK